MSEQETLRDTFAAAALTGVLRKLRPGSVFDLTITARQAFEIADAMLRERARNGAVEGRDPPPPVLTEAEREAVEGALFDAERRGCQMFSDTLRALLARLGGAS